MPTQSERRKSIKQKMQVRNCQKFIYAGSLRSPAPKLLNLTARWHYVGLKKKTNFWKLFVFIQSKRFFLQIGPIWRATSWISELFKHFFPKVKGKSQKLIHLRHRHLLERKPTFPHLDLGFHAGSGCSHAAAAWRLTGRSGRRCRIDFFGRYEFWCEFPGCFCCWTPCRSTDTQKVFHLYNN